MSKNEFGIVRFGFGHPWYLGYGPHGWGRWLPRGIQRVPITVWNRTICTFNGHIGYHDEHEDVPCVHCGLRK